MTISEQGAWQGSLQYGPWGEQAGMAGDTPTSFRYTGQRWEEAMGLAFYKARWYDPALGRFLSPDTIVPDQYDPQSWDRFSYTRNNPVNRVDPTGHMDDVPDGPGCYDDNCRKVAKVKADLYSVLKTVENSSDADKLSYAALALDYSAFLLSVIEAGVSDAVIIGFTAIGCGGGGAFGPATIPAGCGGGALAGLGVDVWFSGWGSPLGAAENILGGLSLGFTATGDFLSGYTLVDIRQGNIRIGKDTIVSSRNFFLGQVPESNWDAWVSMSQAKYDTDRLLGKKQGGSYEIVSNGKLNRAQAVWAGYHFYLSDWW